MAIEDRSRPRPQPNGAVVASAPPEERLIVALDFPDAQQALHLVDQLEGATRWLKVGLELYIAEGKALVDELHRRGYSVFLDLKLHDIPNTVASAVRSASRMGVGMLTVHAGGGPSMLATAVEAARGGPAILAVTVLTSLDDEELQVAGVPGGAAAQVHRLAKMAIAGGVQGLVCSPQETASLRLDLGDQPLLVIPGVRPEGVESGDQRRVATPAAAMAAGASYLVVGRPITRAADPRAAARAILAEMVQSFS